MKEIDWDAIVRFILMFITGNCAGWGIATVIGEKRRRKEFFKLMESTRLAVEHYTNELSKWIPPKVVM